MSALPIGPTPAVDVLLGALDAAVGELVEADLDTLGEPEIGRMLAAEERAIRRLQAHQSRLTATLTRRRAERARTDRPDDPGAPQRAERQVRAQLTDELGITPSRAKQVARTGRQVETLPATAAAHADGQLTDQHVAVIAEVTAHTSGQDRRAFEAELVTLAGRCRDAVVFGRQARALLAERDHDAAMADLNRKRARRSGRLTQTPEGTTVLRLDTVGLDGELVHTVVDAFRTPDATGAHRTAEQRTHDAIMAAFQTALRTGAAATQHGVRPQVAVIVRADSIRDRDGTAATRWTGPLPYAAVARLLGDCVLTRIVADAHDVPLSVSKKVRTVPAGLWTLLVARDGGCIVAGCDAPAGWCEVAHLDTPFVDDGKLTPDTAGLLCASGANHHRAYDTRGWTPTWRDGRPVVVIPRSRDRTGRDAGTGRGGPDRDRPDTEPPRLVRETRAPYTTGTGDPPTHPRGRGDPAGRAAATRPPPGPTHRAA